MAKKIINNKNKMQYNFEHRVYLHNIVYTIIGIPVSASIDLLLDKYKRNYRFLSSKYKTAELQYDGLYFYSANFVIINKLLNDLIRYAFKVYKKPIPKLLKYQSKFGKLQLCKNAIYHEDTDFVDYLIHNTNIVFNIHHIIRAFKMRNIDILDLLLESNKYQFQFREFYTQQLITKVISFNHSLLTKMVYNSLYFTDFLTFNHINTIPFNNFVIVKNYFINKLNHDTFKLIITYL
jgi:hypothetical protein